MPVRLTALVKLIGFALVSLMARPASADVYQWEWIDPGDHSLGRRQSSTPVVDGVGREAVAGSWHYRVDFTKGWFHELELTGFQVTNSKLQDADFSEANLIDGSFYGSTLTGATFAGAQIEGASFEGTEGLTPAQIYDTASYQAKNLKGVHFGRRFLSGWSFVEQDLTGAHFFEARVAGADFTNAVIRGAHFGGTETGALTAAQLYSTASYQTGDLAQLDLRISTLSSWNFHAQNLSEAYFYRAIALGADFSEANLSAADLNSVDARGADFTNANLTNAVFYGAKVGDADFDGAIIGGARFTASGLALAQLYDTASYQTGDLRGAALEDLNLDNANFADMNLTGVSFRWSTVNGIDLNQAIVRDADFSLTTGAGLTSEMLYETASFQARDLAGIRLGSNNLQGWNFANQNLASASFESANCTGADFSNANLAGAQLNGANLSGVNLNQATIRGASFDFASELTKAQIYSTLSYQADDLAGIGLAYQNLANWDFANADLTGANFANSDLTGVVFTGAKIDGVDFSSVVDLGFTANQFYSTASYQSGNLAGMRLGRGNNLAGWDFSGKNLGSCDFSSDNEGGAYTSLYGSNFDDANLTDGDFLHCHILYATFVGADTRGSNLSLLREIPFTRHTIHFDGALYGLDIAAGETMRLWDYDGETPIPIHVANPLRINSSGKLRIVIDDDEWGSKMTFAAGTSVALDGTLELLVEPEEGVTLASLVGTTFQLFDWTGVEPIGAFDVSSPYQWDLTNLYVTGEATLVAVPGLAGDFDQNGVVDGADFLAWQRGESTTPLSPVDFAEWQNQFGAMAAAANAAAVPEPAGVFMLVVAVSVLVVRSRARQC